jgi:uncharacterized membrane protein
MVSWIIREARLALLAVACVGLSAPALAQAPPSSQAPAGTTAPAARPAAARTELILCNKTGGDIQIAIAYVHAQSNRWMLSAWHNRAPGECKTFAAVKPGLFYYHAKNNRGSVWPGEASAERRYCVPNTAVNRDMSSQCGAGEAVRPFRGRSMEPGKYTFSFT